MSDPTKPDDDPTDRPERTPHPRRDRIRGLARRIFREIDEELGSDHGAPRGERPDRAADRGSDKPPRESAPPPADERARREVWDLVAGVLETGDKAKTEIVRLVAREVRSYLEALELHKDLHHLLTNYSLEVKASIHLKPLGDALAPESPDSPTVSTSLQPLDE